MLIVVLPLLPVLGPVINAVGVAAWKTVHLAAGTGSALDIIEVDPLVGVLAGAHVAFTLLRSLGVVLFDALTSRFTITSVHFVGL